MKKLAFLFCLLFSGLSMSAQTKVVRKTPAKKAVSSTKKTIVASKTANQKTPSNKPKKDYVNFDESGLYLVSFRHTCEDGSYMEIEGKHYHGNDYFYRPVTICDAEGNKYTGTFYIGPNSCTEGICSQEECYKKASYNNYIKMFARCLESYHSIKDSDYDETFIELKDGSKKIFFSDDCSIRAIEVKDGDGFIKYRCNQTTIPKAWEEVKEVNIDLANIPLGDIAQRYTIYSNGKAFVVNYGNVYEAKIEYGNGDEYIGELNLYGMPLDSDSFKSGTSMPQFTFTNGVKKLKDGTIRVYVNGEIDELESKKPAYKNMFKKK